MLTIAEIRACSWGICSSTPNGLFFGKLGYFLRIWALMQEISQLPKLLPKPGLVGGELALLRQIGLFFGKLGYFLRIWALMQEISQLPKPLPISGRVRGELAVL